MCGCGFQVVQWQTLQVYVLPSSSPPQPPSTDRKCWYSYLDFFYTVSWLRNSTCISAVATSKQQNDCSLATQHGGRQVVLSKRHVVLSKRHVVLSKRHAVLLQGIWTWANVYTYLSETLRNAVTLQYCVKFRMKSHTERRLKQREVKTEEVAMTSSSGGRSPKGAPMRGRLTSIQQQKTDPPESGRSGLEA